MNEAEYKRLTDARMILVSVERDLKNVKGRADEAETFAKNQNDKP
jgi:hypothetical protein